MERCKFYILRSKDNKWYFEFKAANGEEIVRSSEMYESEQACFKAIHLLQEHAATAEVNESIIEKLLKGYNAKNRFKPK